MTYVFYGKCPHPAEKFIEIFHKSDLYHQTHLIHLNILDILPGLFFF